MVKGVAITFHSSKYDNIYIANSIFNQIVNDINKFIYDLNINSPDICTTHNKNYIEKSEENIYIATWFAKTCNYIIPISKSTIENNCTRFYEAIKIYIEKSNLSSIVILVYLPQQESINMINR